VGRASIAAIYMSQPKNSMAFDGMLTLKRGVRMRIC